MRHAQWGIFLRGGEIALQQRIRHRRDHAFHPLGEVNRCAAGTVKACLEGERRLPEKTAGDIPYPLAGIFKGGILRQGACGDQQAAALDEPLQLVPDLQWERIGAWQHDDPPAQAAGMLQTHVADDGIGHGLAVDIGEVTGSAPERLPNGMVAARNAQHFRRVIGPEARGEVAGPAAFHRVKDRDIGHLPASFGQENAASAPLVELGNFFIASLAPGVVAGEAVDAADDLPAQSPANLIDRNDDPWPLIAFGAPDLRVV